MFTQRDKILRQKEQHPTSKEVIWARMWIYLESAIVYLTYKSLSMNLQRLHSQQDSRFFIMHVCKWKFQRQGLEEANYNSIRRYEKTSKVLDMYLKLFDSKLDLLMPIVFRVNKE